MVLVPKPVSGIFFLETTSPNTATTSATTSKTRPKSASAYTLPTSATTDALPTNTATTPNSYSPAISESVLATPASPSSPWASPFPFPFLPSGSRH